MQDEQKQYGLKHSFTDTINAEIGDMLKKVYVQLVESMFGIWDR